MSQGLFGTHHCATLDIPAETGISEQLKDRKCRVENQAGERTGVRPPALGTKAGSTRLRFGGYSGKNPGIPNFCREFG